MLREMEVEIVELPASAPLSVGSTAQVVRLALPAHASLWDAELVITSDADSLPIQASYFAQRDPAKQFTVYNADILDYGEFAMCYLEGSAAVWREVLNLPSQPASLAEALRTVHAGTDTTWSTDQQVITSRLKAWSGYNQSGTGRTQFVELPPARPFRLNRICCGDDDGVWKAHFADWRAGAFTAVDFHLFRYKEGEYSHKWRWTKDVLGVLFPPSVVRRLDSYVLGAIGPT